MFLKRQVPVVVALFTGFAVILQYFFKIDAWSQLTKDILSWNVIISAFALGIAMGNVIALHSGNIRRRSENSFYSAVLLVTMSLWFIMGVTMGTTDKTYQLLFDSLLVSAQSTVLGTTAFFITSAAYRAFRVKNAQGAVLLISAILVMGRVGAVSALWPGFQAVSNWIMAIPNTAGMRGVTIGGAMAVVGNAMRVLLGLERNYLGGDN